MAGRRRDRSRCGPWPSAWRHGVLALGLLAAACGFEPLYGTRGDDAGVGRIAVEVAPIAERDGQILRAALNDTFDRGRAPEYRMDVALSERIEVFAIDARGDAIRKRMTVNADWRLTPMDIDGGPPIKGSARAFEAYNVLDSDYANLAAERAARERAAKRLADEIAAAATARARSPRLTGR